MPHDEQRGGGPQHLCVMVVGGACDPHVSNHQTHTRRAYTQQHQQQGQTKRTEDDGLEAEEDILVAFPPRVTIHVFVLFAFFVLVWELLQHLVLFVLRR